MMIVLDVVIVLVALVAIGSRSRVVVAVLLVLLTGRTLLRANEKRVHDKNKE